MRIKRSVVPAGASPGQDAIAPPAVRFVVISRDASIRTRLREVLEQGQEEVAVVEAASGHEGLAAARNHQPSAVLVDGDLPGLSGAAVAATIARTHLSVTVILLTPAVDFDHLAVSAICGATPLRRDAGADELRRVLQNAASERCRYHPWPIPPDGVAYADGFVSARGGSTQMTLTDRQAAVLDCVLMGIPTKSLPEALGTTEYRARKDLVEMLRALGARTKVNAVAAAFERGWTTGGRPPAVVNVERPGSAEPSAPTMAAVRRDPLPLYPDLWEFAM